MVLRAGAMIAGIALADWWDRTDLPLGFLYLFPMLLLGSSLSRWQIAIAASLCTFLTECFDSFDWHPEGGVSRDILIFAAFFCMGLFVYEAIRNRKIAQEHLSQIESQIEARREAEEQLKVLVESSPAAIFTTNSDGCILLANDAAHRLFAVPTGTLSGTSLQKLLPSLVKAAALDQNRLSFRTAMQCRGRRADGNVFLADVWFSTYRTSAGPRLAAMVADTSEDLRTREEMGLHQLLASSRILVGAVSHEVRNVCGAIAMVHENLSRTGTLACNKDFEALGTLVKALEKIAAIDLRTIADQATITDLYSLLEELRIVAEPSLNDAGITVRWDLDAYVPTVWADRHSLMQVFLNVIKNAQRAMQDRPVRELTVRLKEEQTSIYVSFTDTGGGVAYPNRLFRPFQQGSEATGLGLYLSRALMRSFKGDLRYEPLAGGSSFVVELLPVTSESQDENYEQRDPDSTGRRSPFVSGESQPVAPGNA